MDQQLTEEQKLDIQSREKQFVTEFQELQNNLGLQMRVAPFIDTDGSIKAEARLLDTKYIPKTNVVDVEANEINYAESEESETNA